MTGKASRIASWQGGGLLVLSLVGGCVSQTAQVQDTEQMLAAAGFRAQPAPAPQQQAPPLPPLRLMMQPRRVGNATEVYYVYADPEVCHCVFTGGPDDFARFQQLVFQQRLADQYTAAAEMQQQADFGWPWGPGFWMPGPVIVPHGHHQVNDHDYDHDRDDHPHH